MAVLVQFSVTSNTKVITCGRGVAPSELPCTWHSLDVSDAGAVGNVATVLCQIDIFVKNGGIHAEKTVTQGTDVDLGHVIGANRKDECTCCRASTPHLAEGGSIINIGSNSGDVADRPMALCGVSKAFVHGLVLSVSVDHGRYIRVDVQEIVPDRETIKQAFYCDIGKVTIRINMCLLDHVAIRLQAAVRREAVYMAVEGVAWGEGIDGGIWAAFELRWVAMGSRYCSILAPVMGPCGPCATIFPTRSTHGGTAWETCT